MLSEMYTLLAAMGKKLKPHVQNAIDNNAREEKGKSLLWAASQPHKQWTPELWKIVGAIASGKYTNSQIAERHGCDTRHITRLRKRDAIQSAVVARRERFALALVDKQIDVLTADVEKMNRVITNRFKENEDGELDADIATKDLIRLRNDTLERLEKLKSKLSDGEGGDSVRVQIINNILSLSPDDVEKMRREQGMVLDLTKQKDGVYRGGRSGKK